MHADGRLLRPRPVGEHPQLFRKQPYNLTGLDNHGSELVADYADTAFDVIDDQIFESGDVVATVDAWLRPSARFRYRLTLQRSSATGHLRIGHADVAP